MRRTGRQPAELHAEFSLSVRGRSSRVPGCSRKHNNVLDVLARVAKKQAEPEAEQVLPKHVAKLALLHNQALRAPLQVRAKTPGTLHDKAWGWGGHLKPGWANDGVTGVVRPATAASTSKLPTTQRTRAPSRGAQSRQQKSRGLVKPQRPKVMAPINHKTGFSDHRQGYSHVDQSVVDELFELMVKKLDSLYENPKQAYMALNADRANGVDMVAFTDAMRRMNILSPQQCEQGYADALFDRCDRNKDGCIDYSEWCRYMRTDDKHHALMVRREDPYRGERGGMSWNERTGWIRSRLGSLCE